MKIDAHEEATLRKLEVEIGHKIPRVLHSDVLPKESNVGKYRSRETKTGKLATFDSFTGHGHLGCFICDDGHVVGLALCAMNLTRLPSPVLDLQFLRRLNLGDNKLRTLPRKIAELTELDQLQLYGNRFSNVPSGMLSLSHLEMLNFAYNSFENFPVSLLSLPNLNLLYIFGNRISSLNENVFRSNFQIIVDRSKQKTADIAKVIFVESNPIESPPVEIARRGSEAVLAYFSALTEETLPLNEVKVIVVGDGGAGKTSLVKRLLEKGYDPHEAQTHGINIDAWNVDTSAGITVLNIWDFGGQEIMHATHQFFLSERSLYVLVLDGRKEEDPEYWLKHVQSFGGDSPVLVVLNKVDQNPGFEVNRRFLNQKFPSIHSFHRVSCETNDGLSEISAAIAAAIDLVDITRTEWPKPWFEIKKDLENFDDNYIRYDDFRSLCCSHGVEDSKRQETLVAFLHDLGSVVYFSDFRLRDTHVLDPRWLTGAVYRIINATALAENHGILQLSEITSILENHEHTPSYPPETHAYIIDIMKKFELCYSLENNSILVPDLLDVQEPRFDFSFNSSLAFEIHYDFLPRSVLPRFIVRQHTAIYEELRWRTGAVLEDTTLGCRAVVRSDQSAKKIYIYVSGKQKRDYLTVIRASFAEIHASFEKLEFRERLPMPDDPNVSVSYKHLLLLEGQGQAQYFPDGGTHPYEVQELLGTVRLEATYGEKDLIRILRSIVNETDSEERIVEKANSVLMMQPNFFGLGININSLAQIFIKKRK